MSLNHQNYHANTTTLYAGIITVRGRQKMASLPPRTARVMSSCGQQFWQFDSVRTRNFLFGYGYVRNTY